MISGNLGDGIEIKGKRSFVVHNFIGTDKTGSAKLGNGESGIRVAFAPDAAPPPDWNAVIESNVISANKIGVQVQGSDTKMIANVIGRNREAGIKVTAQRNMIGSLVVARHDGGNTIEGNGTQGVWVDGRRATFNWIAWTNRIRWNKGRGIQLTRKANQEIQPPTLTEATWDMSRKAIVQGTFHGVPHEWHHIAFFANFDTLQRCDRMGFPGQGAEPLTFVTVRTDPRGAVSFRATVVPRHGGQYVSITATATHFVPHGAMSRGNTSEFSRCVYVH